MVTLPKEMQEILDEMDHELDNVTNWTQRLVPKDDGAHQHDARFFEGTANGWKFVVTDFDIEDQGFPAGIRGVDGAGNNLEKQVVMRYTRELAEKASRLACAATGAKPPVYTTLGKGKHDVQH